MILWKYLNLWKKVVSETVKNDRKKQKQGFFGMLLVALGPTLLFSLLKGKGVGRLNTPRCKANILGRNWYGKN